jgi:cation transport ATPase
MTGSLHVTAVSERLRRRQRHCSVLVAFASSAALHHATVVFVQKGRPRWFEAVVVILGYLEMGAPNENAWEHVLWETGI